MYRKGVLLKNVLHKCPTRTQHMRTTCVLFYRNTCDNLCHHNFMECNEAPRGFNYLC